MKNDLSFTEKRIHETGLYLAEFALEFLPGDAALNSYDANDFLLLFDIWYNNFIRYAETNGLVSCDELLDMQENRDDLDVFIKAAAIDAAREIIMDKHAFSAQMDAEGQVSSLSER